MAKSESNKAVANLMGWVEREAIWGAAFETAFKNHTDAILEASALSREDLGEILGDAAGQLFGCIFEDFAAQCFESAPHNMVDDYLKRRGWRESVPSRRYMEALRDAVMSLYEVTDVRPGEWVEVRDLVRGAEPVRVFEHLGSKEMVPWDRLGARVVEHLGKKVFTGAILLYSAQKSEALKGQIDASIAATFAQRGIKRRRPERPEINAAIADTLALLGPTFTANWLAERIADHAAPPPTLVNSEGDMLQFAETRFPLRPGAAVQIASRLDLRKDLLRADDSSLAWDWFAEGDPCINTGGEGLSLEVHDADTGAHLLGSLQLDEGVLRLSTNSVSRAERATKMLRTTLGKLIGAGLTSLTSAQDVIEGAREPGTARAEADADADAEENLAPEIPAEIARRFLDRYYRDWMRLPIPALNGRSPVQAVRSKRGRDEVVALLKHVENMEARQSRASGHASYDFAWLWQELGLAERRR